MRRGQEAERSVCVRGSDSIQELVKKARYLHVSVGKTVSDTKKRSKMSEGLRQQAH